jgi:hypothetical protein
MSKNTSAVIGQCILPGSVKDAIEEQQSRVWRLHSLIECIRVISDSSEEVQDFGAAISVVLELADSIHSALDVGTIAERAKAIEEENEEDDASRAVVRAAISKARK